MAHMKPFFAMQQLDLNQTVADSRLGNPGIRVRITETRRWGGAFMPRRLDVPISQKISRAYPPIKNTRLPPWVVRPHNAAATRCRM